ncbi:hypothetical protein UPYG_G00043530 [Umbra pygmaea]|uniref:VLIG-type G domain-containing protein n=1 Tax=Umbra pygmaea TaxID=75934 RepID=A0ABD0XQJ5_UMBPY
MEELRKKQQSYEMTDAMKNFINGISSKGTEILYFLKWMRIHLDNLSRQNRSGLKDKYKEIQQNKSEKKEMTDVDNQKQYLFDLNRQNPDCSLGLEHFLRELGQLYESACYLPEESPQWKQIKHLPGLCAQMLLDGFSVELVDGDASNIPLKWISAVLTQLHTIVSSNSKIRVVTVIGVQSTGKSTLLNTMFGVQFAVSSGRCTRGAFMQLIKVNKDLKEELKCDFIMVIDTEGLKSLELAKLEDSYEHDNELATLVVGLSDFTIINISMENSTEMKDILQIVVHAFLRMKEVGKKPICHFVHQNVSDMSAHDNNMRAREELLEQLNEMTQAAARMENKANITKFTDVMVYDPNTSSSYIPGLWYGTPPMAPVNAGYSEAVNDLKKSLIQGFRKCQKTENVLNFMIWTKSLWESVKFENFIFSFRNSLVADAYTRLCTDYNSWEWAFQKEMYSWIMCAETNISNFGLTGQTTTPYTIHHMQCDLEREASEKLSLEEEKILDNLAKYFESNDGHVSLVEKYREDFVASAKTLRRETENKLKDTLYAVVKIKEGMAKLNEIKTSHANTLEKKVIALLQTCRQKKSDLSNEDLREEFEKMWEETLSEINFSGFPRRDVTQVAFHVLGRHFSTRGGHVNNMMIENNLVDCGNEPFVVKSGCWWCMAKGLVKHGDLDHQKKKLQNFCDNIIKNCQEYITQKVQNKSDFHDTYINELLEIIDETLQKKKRKVNEECEVSLKLHICGIAAREFQKMHDHFNTVNDPRKCLEQSKSKYMMDFIDMFHERDQCQKKADDFTKLCLKPAVRDYVTKMIGPDVVDEMRKGKASENFSTRVFFQFSILKQLLTEGRYDKYKQYISNYEQFVKKWLFDHIVIQLSNESTLEKLEKTHLTEIVRIITDAIVKVRNTTTTNTDIKTFIQNLCSALGDKLVLPKDALDSIMTLNYSEKTDQFADNLTEFVEEMEQTLEVKYIHETDITERLRSLPFKPQDKMFTSLFGCGEVCPFCSAPCEAGGKEHSKHFTSIHRPQGVTGWRNRETKVLVSNICSSSVISDLKFKTPLNKDQYHPLKDYQKYYPEWKIAGDSSIEASDYWKYVMATFNERIAEDWDALPAVIPEDWKDLESEDAMKSLKGSFNVKD